jgi:DnaJ domain
VKSFADILNETLEPASEVAPAPVPSFDQTVWAMRAVAMIETAMPWWASALGVSAACTVEMLKAAYRRRALSTHPDRSGGSHEAFLAAAEAYEAGLAHIQRQHGVVASQCARRYAAAA